MFDDPLSLTLSHEGRGKSGEPLFYKGRGKDRDNLSHNGVMRKRDIPSSTMGEAKIGMRYSISEQGKTKIKR